MIDEIVKCPSCGEENPADAMQCEDCGESINEAADPADVQNTGVEAETILWRGRPSYLAYTLFYIMGVVFLVLGYLYSFFEIWAIALGAFLIIISIMDRNSKVYTITDTKIRLRSNMHRYNIEIPVKKITDINLQRRSFEKLFGLGTVRIVSEVSAKRKTEIEFKGLSNWREIMQKIETLRAEQ
jgi:hypothetical protein